MKYTFYCDNNKDGLDKFYNVIITLYGSNMIKNDNAVAYVSDFIFRKLYINNAIEEVIEDKETGTKFGYMFFNFGTKRVKIVCAETDSEVTFLIENKNKRSELLDKVMSLNNIDLCGDEKMSVLSEGVKKLEIQRMNNGELVVFEVKTTETKRIMHTLEKDK